MAKGRSKQFGKDQRLLDKAAFDRVFARAAPSRDALFTVLCRHNGERDARLGLAIAKKNSRRATARNRIKRVIRESFREHQASLAGLDIVVMNRPGADSASNQRLFGSLEKHWQHCSNAKPTPQDS